jgi:vancomycin resistance protein VanJ
VSAVRAIVTLLGALLCVGLVALSVVHVVAPQRDGLPALTQILAPYLFLLVVPFLLLLRTPGTPGRALRWGVAAAVLVFIVRFVPGWVSLPGSAPASAAGQAQLGVVTWNLELGQPDDTTVVDTLRGFDAQVIGLVELTPWHADAIVQDPELVARYPTVELRPTDGSLGIGLLATLPASAPARLYRDPPILVQQLDAGDGRTVTVVVAHPLPARIQAAGNLIPIGYDSTSRDRHLARVRAIVDPILASGEPLMLIGDFNVVDREPGYADLARGLVDAHRAAGLGPGDTWRPPRLDGLPFGLLRIDYLFSANGVAPLSIGVDCTPRGSDHCIVQGRMALPVTGP